MLDLTIEKVQEGLTTGAFTSVDLVKACLARISEASEFNSVLQVNPEAVPVAEQLDEERKRLGSRGYHRPLPFHKFLSDCSKTAARHYNLGQG